MRFVKALSRRIPTAAVGNLALLLTLVLLCHAYVDFPWISGASLTCMALVTIWRLKVARAAAHLHEDETRLWLRRFGLSTVAASVIWGVAAAAWLFAHGLEPATVLVMVTTAGVAGAAANVSAPSLPVLRAFTLMVLTPSVLVLVGHRPTTLAVGLAIVLAIYCSFLWIQGGHMHNDFLEAQTRAYRLEKQSHHLRDSREAMRVQATRDGLTGALNRTAGVAAMEHELARSRREQRDLAVVMFDIDHFKRINDNHGHAAGDTVLRECSRRLRAAIRPYDMFARFGGEEFVLILPGCNLEAAATVAERLRLAMAQTPFEHQGTSMVVTSSFGVSMAMREDDVASTLARADANLYEAKRGGRDRVTAK